MKTEHLDACPACSGTRLTPQPDIKDFYYSGESFPQSECGTCGLYFTQNRPAAADIGKYYDSANYASHDSGKKKSAFLRVYQMARNWMLNHKFEIIRQFKPELKQVLDYGTGEGFFTEFLLKKGKDADGIEPSELARENFRQRTGKTLYESLEGLPPKSYQAITLWHVLEHIHDLRPTMQTLVDRLERYGIIVIAVPNRQSADCREFGEAWAAWDVPRHLYHWDTDSLGRFMESFSLQRIYTGHLPLDPFYIGLISARYAKKSALSGLITGFRSYLHGKSHPDKGSTLLTVWMKN